MSKRMNIKPKVELNSKQLDFVKNGVKGSQYNIGLKLSLKKSSVGIKKNKNTLPPIEKK
jgi:hypothetical protein